MTHLDLSGIQAINMDNILDILNELSDYQKCGNLLSLHMNDLGLNFNSHVSDEIMDIF